MSRDVSGSSQCSNWPAEGDIAAVFGEVARQNADCVAVEDDGETLSYRDLDRLAARIADAVLASASAPGQPVALLLGNGIPVIAAILGVLRTGAPYVVLDPAHPLERRERILRCARPDLVITESRAAAVSGLPANVSCRPLVLDALPGADGTLAGGVAISPAPEAPAGLYYTSGSTGEPKGVQRSHAQILHRCRFEIDADAIGPDDTVSLLYSCAYGASVTDIFNALLSGARLSLFDVRQRGLPALRAWIAARRVSLLHLPVALFRQLLQTPGRGEDFAGVRQLVPSGRLFRRDVEQFRGQFPQHCVMVSRMASTETSLISRLLIDRNTRFSGETVPVGYAVPGKRVTIIDENLRELGPGEVGQIVVNSDYLSPGYWGSPDENAARFRRAQDPGGERSYLTGDLGRLSRDGCLEFLGRLDNQLKIRGYRVDPGEVEAALWTLQGLQHVALVPRDGPDGEPTLACYLSFQYGAPCAVAGIRRVLAERLPDYMIPSTITVLDEMPLTPNAKIDYRRLPEPRRARAPLPGAAGSLRPASESRIATIWADVLGIDEVDLQESFVALGGHSLLATRAAMRIAEELGVEVSPADLLGCSTVADIAARIADADGRQAEWPPLLPCDHAQAQPLSFGQGRLWFEQLLHPESVRYNMPKLLRLEGALDVAALARALDILLERHAVLRSVIADTEAGPLQQIVEGVTLALPLVDLEASAEGGHDARLRTEIARVVATPFDLARAPMLRAALFRLERSLHLLLLVTHHVATDRHSSALLVSELSAIYRCCAEGREISLPRAGFQYVDFALWQHRLQEGGFLQRQGAYWQQKLQGAPLQTRFPADRPGASRPGARRFASREVRLLPADLTRSLRALCRQAHCTRFSALLAALNLLLLSCSGQEDLVVGAPASSRCHREMERVAGFFANTVALRTQLHGDPTVAALLAQCSTTTIEAWRNVQFPFEQVLQMLQFPRDRGATPLIQVLLTCIEDGDPACDFGSLGATRLGVQTPEVAFELEFRIQETPHGLEVQAGYDRELFEQGTVERLLDGFHRMLDLMCRSPGQRISVLARHPWPGVAGGGADWAGKPDWEVDEI